MGGCSSLRECEMLSVSDLEPVDHGLLGVHRLRQAVDETLRQQTSVEL